MIEPIDVKKVAETNPAVDVSKLEQADALRKQAEKIGGHSGKSLGARDGVSQSRIGHRRERF